MRNRVTRKKKKKKGEESVSREKEKNERYLLPCYISRLNTRRHLSKNAITVELTSPRPEGVVESRPFPHEGLCPRIHREEGKQPPEQGGIFCDDCVVVSQQRTQPEFVVAGQRFPVDQSREHPEGEITQGGNIPLSADSIAEIKPFRDGVHYQIEVVLDVLSCEGMVEGFPHSLPLGVLHSQAFSKQVGKKRTHSHISRPRVLCLIFEKSLCCVWIADHTTW